MGGSVGLEAERVATLRSLGILDTPAEERFDRLARLAARSLDAPIALVSLVDEDRQWFKSCIGVDMRETPRALSFCAHALGGVEPLVVEDATADARFAGNPLVTGAPGIRFYAGHPIRAAGGEPLGTLCVIDVRPRTATPEQLESLRDLAGLVELELGAGELSRALAARRESEARIAAVLDAAEEGIVGVDEERLVQYLSGGASRLLRREPAASRGRPVDEIVGSLAGTAGEGRIARADGEPIDVEYRWTPMPAAAPEPGEVLVFRDITDRRELERARERFLRAAAHELRTPLTSLRGYAEELLEPGAAPLDEDRRLAAEAVLRNAGRLDALVEDMLLVLRLESGAAVTTPEPVALAELVRGVAARLAPQARRAGVELVVHSTEATLPGDPRLLERAVSGLLGTAIAVSPARSAVRVHLRADEAAAVLTITDAGGVLEEELRLAHDPFYRSTARPQADTTGFSATIARGVAKLHGGRAELGVAGGGTAVTLILPLRAQASGGVKR